MAKYVLIHGGLHGSWCWDKVTPLLRRKGHLVEAPDLPGHGKDKTPIQEVTLQSCVNKVCNIIRTKSDPVILVGHSISGIIISQVAEQIPDKIRTLVFLTAYLLQDGESLNSVLERCRHLISFSPDHSYFTINNKKADLFYNNCSAEDVTRAKKLLCSESTAFFKTPVRLSNENFGVVPRIYIECLHDQIISPRDQKAMYTTTPCLKVISLNTGHSPFFSTPELLAAHLASIAN